MRILKALSQDTGALRTVLGAALLLLALPLLGACQQKSAQATPEEAAAVAEANAGAPADSLATGADSAGVEEAAEEEKGGFFSRVFGGRKDKEQEEEEEPVPVELALVENQDVPLFLSATATLEAEKKADILAKISGEIREMRSEEGDWVREGQVLAVLDGEAQRVALEESEARARACRLDHERIASLHEQGLTSDKELHDAKFRHEEAEAQTKAARLQLEYTEIVAPFSGRIGQRFVDLGQTVSVGTPIFSLVDPDPLLARIHLPEKEVARISPEQGIVINPDADPGLRFAGHVLRVAPMVDPRTGTVKTTCQVSEQANVLRPGSFVRVRIQTDIHPNVSVIPKRALVPEGGETYVFKADGDTVIKVPVSTGFANGKVVEIVHGLSVGDRVVTVGQGGLKTGSKFREITEDPDTLAAGSEPDSGSVAE